MYQNHRRYYHFHRCSMRNNKIGLSIREIDTSQAGYSAYFCNESLKRIDKLTDFFMEHFNITNKLDHKYENGTEQ